jgi:hypothetical protein
MQPEKFRGKKHCKGQLIREKIEKELIIKKDVFFLNVDIKVIPPFRD